MWLEQTESFPCFAASVGGGARPDGSVSAGLLVLLNPTPKIERVTSHGANGRVAIGGPYLLLLSWQHDFRTFRTLSLESLTSLGMGKGHRIAYFLENRQELAQGVPGERLRLAGVDLIEHLLQGHSLDQLHRVKHLPLRIRFSGIPRPLPWCASFWSAAMELDGIAAFRPAQTVNQLTSEPTGNTACLRP